MIRGPLAFKPFGGLGVGNGHDACVVDQDIDGEGVAVRGFRRCTDGGLRCEVQFKQGDGGGVGGLDGGFSAVKG